MKENTTEVIQSRGIIGCNPCFLLHFKHDILVREAALHSSRSTSRLSGYTALTFLMTYLQYTYSVCVCVRIRGCSVAHINADIRRNTC